jgi:VIT1/CCC1 family predicted Fe2+/Mn2+ transporter
MSDSIPTLEHDHSPEAIEARLGAEPPHSYLRDWVYGGIDGAITTFAIVSGVAGAQLSARVIVILGVANLIADGFSMAASNYAGTKAEHELLERARDMEHRHIDLEPEGERNEVREIYRRKGLRGDGLRKVVDQITSDRAVWVGTMLSEEHGLPRAIRSPWLAALSTFSAFAVCGAVPLVPFLAGASRALELATGLTAAVFLTIGALKARWTIRSPWRSALETLAIGSIAAGLAYAVGLLLAPFV